MENRKLMIALLAVGSVLILAAGIVYLATGQGRQGNTFKPPASLSDYAEEYPKLADILEDPELDSVYKDFLVAYEEGGEEGALELARKRHMLTPDDAVAITLILDSTDNDALIEQLESVDVTIVSAYQDRINIAVPVDVILEELESDMPGATFQQLTELDHVIAVELPETNVIQGSTIDGEGVAIIDADVWHQAGFTGAGLRIGVLDLGFSGHEALLGEELPDSVPVATFGWYDEEEVHGTACAEIIHEVAPDAQLYFAWYDGSDAAMGEAVEWLKSQGVHIISHSAGGLVGPRDGTEWDALLVDELAGQGILWVNAAGNEGLAHYRGVYTDADGDNFHEFAPGDEMMALFNRGFVKVILSWEDTWGQASSDYELYLYDSAGNQLAASQDPQTGEAGHEPVEGIIYETGGDTVFAVIEAYDVAGAATLDIYTYPGDVGYPSPAYSISPPGDALGSLTVGAVNWWDDSLAEYSSQGPTSDGRLKPEISAPAGVSGATYGTSNSSYDSGFAGTSASCPHTAGAAALVWQAHPEFSRQEVIDFLLNRAVDLGPSGADTGFGYGRLYLGSAPSAAPPPATPPAPQPTPGTTGPLPTPTPLTYVTVTPGPPPPPPPDGGGTGAGLGALVTGVGCLVVGLGCGGGVLLILGAVGLVVMGRRSKQARPAPPPPQPHGAPQGPPAHPPTRPGPGTTQCPSCGAVVRVGTDFCSNCGATLKPQAQARFCRHCGNQIKEGASFCPKCGNRV